MRLPATDGGKNVDLKVDGKTTFRTVQSASKVEGKQHSWMAGATFLDGSKVPFLSGGYGESKEEGFGRWIDQPAGIYGDNVKLELVGGLELNAAQINAQSGTLYTNNILSSDLLDEYNYESDSWSVSFGLNGLMPLTKKDGTEPKVPPMVNSMQSTASIPGVINWAEHKEKKTALAHSMVSGRIEIKKLDGTELELLGNIVRDETQFYEVLTDQESTRSVGIPIINLPNLVNNFKAVSATAQDLKNRLMQQFDTQIVKISHDQPELKAQIETIKESFSEIAQDVAEEVIKLANSENVLKRLQEKQQSILKGKSIEEANFEELQSLSNEMEKERSTIRFSDVRDIEGVPIVLGHPGYREALLKKYRIELKGENTLQEIVQELPLEQINHLVEDLRNELIAEVQWMHDQSVKMVKVVYDNRVVIIEKTLDVIQVGLDIGGIFIPIGLDLTNAAIHEARGHHGEAMLSLAAAVPIVGDVATSAKYTVKGAKFAKEVYVFTKKEIALEKRLIESRLPKETVGGIFREANELEKGIDVLSDIGKAKSPWKSNGNVDMDFHELNGGHAKDRHLHKTDDQLAERIIKEKQERKSRKFEAASSYDSKDQMEHVATTIVRKDPKKIQEWLKNPEDSLILEHDFGSPIGRVLLDGEKSSSLTNFARVVLHPSGKSSDGYVIKTTFPIKELTKK